MPIETVSIAIDELRVGVICGSPIVSEDGVLLIGAGAKITSQLVAGLRERGVSHIDVNPRDLATLRGGSKQKRSTSQKVQRKAVVEFVSGKPVKNLLVDRHEELLSDATKQRLVQNMEQANVAFDVIEAELAAQGIRSVESLADVSDGYARMIVEDHDQTVGELSESGEALTFSQRSVGLSVLGMSIAIDLDLDGLETLEVGMAGLLHDLGLRTMPEKFSQPMETLNAADRWEYQKHPKLSVDSLSKVSEVSSSVHLAMMQVHEQFDGSGYPRGLKGNRIHKHARILNVADTYLELTTPTSVRHGIVPHDAVAVMLQHAARGILDPLVVRSFLNIETMFPLGSTVELSSGKQAQVIRRPLGGFSHPVLIDDEGNRVDMATTRDVEILRPVSGQLQMRIPHDETTAREWHPARLVVV